MIKPLTIKEQFKHINNFRKDEKKLRKECLGLWRKIVVLKAGNKCEFPRCTKNGKTNKMDAHHVFSKGRFGHLKYNPDNGILLCASHHTLGSEAAHKDIFFKDKILGKKDGYNAVRSDQWLILLERKAMSPYKLDINLEHLYLEQEFEKLITK